MRFAVGIAFVRNGRVFVIARCPQGEKVDCISTGVYYLHSSDGLLISININTFRQGRVESVF